MINRLADECYLPANETILANIKESKGLFRVSFSMSGTILELLLKYRPDVVDSFKRILATGSAEIMSETYYHSLSYLYSKKEFRRQVQKHQAFIGEIFGIEPVVFSNTELIYDNQLGSYLSGLGLKAILCEGRNEILCGRSPNHVYKIPGNDDIALLLRNSTLSDDISFRFTDKSWNEYPLTADKFAQWIQMHPADTELITLFLDYETFGIHKRKEDGILDFLKALPTVFKNAEQVRFSLPSDLVKEYPARDVYDVTQTISYEGNPVTLNYWNSNLMQNNALKKLYSLENIVLRSNDASVLEKWSILQASDFFSCMSDQNFEGQRYKYANSFGSPAEMYKYYTEILFDFEISLINRVIANRKSSVQSGNWTLLSD